MLAATLRGYSRFIVDCGGDIRIGGADALVHPYEVFVEHPITGGRAHVLRLGSGGVATSGINVRIWRDADGRYAHHLLDPASGEPAWTGLVGATALGDTALEAETLSKAALLSGPEGGRQVLAERGGLLVHDSGRVELVGPLAVAPRIRLPEVSAVNARTGAADSDLQSHGWWLASRASGLVALVLVTVSVFLGLTMAGKVMRRPGLSKKLLAVHEQTALAGLVAIAVHGIALLGDPWLHPGVAGVAVPFAIGFKTALHRPRRHRRLPRRAARAQLLRPPPDRRQALAQGAPGDGRRLPARPRPRARRRHRRLGGLVPLVGDPDHAA